MWEFQLFAKVFRFLLDDFTVTELMVLWAKMLRLSQATCGVGRGLGGFTGDELGWRKAESHFLSPTPRGYSLGMLPQDATVTTRMTTSIFWRSQLKPSLSPASDIRSPPSFSESKSVFASVECFSSKPILQSTDKKPPIPPSLVKISFALMQTLEHLDETVVVLEEVAALRACLEVALNERSLKRQLKLTQRSE